MSTGSPSKIDLAKEGAIGVVELAYQDDLLGMVVFSDADSAQWVFELRQATERGKREMLNAILGITTSGGTVLEPAYRMALEELAQTEAAVKHVIILSDGKLYDGQGGPFASGGTVDFTAIAQSGLQQDITTSTIAIGDAADFEDRLAYLRMMTRLSGNIVAARNGDTASLEALQEPRTIPAEFPGGRDLAMGGALKYVEDLNDLPGVSAEREYVSSTEHGHRIDLHLNGGASDE
jgi:hypothetical protein